MITAAAGTGIGSATARRALLEGRRRMISDHHERRLDETREALAGLGIGPGRVGAVRCHLGPGRRPDLCTTARLGRMDVLVNNAGLGAIPR